MLKIVTILLLALSTAWSPLAACLELSRPCVGECAVKCLCCCSGGEGEEGGPCTCCQGSDQPGREPEQAPSPRRGGGGASAEPLFSMALVPMTLPPVAVVADRLPIVAAQPVWVLTASRRQAALCVWRT